MGAAFDGVAEHKEFLVFSKIASCSANGGVEISNF